MAGANLHAAGRCEAGDRAEETTQQPRHGTGIDGGRVSVASLSAKIQGEQINYEKREGSACTERSQNGRPRYLFLRAFTPRGQLSSR